MTPAAPVAVRAALRDATQRAHHRVDRLPRMRGLLSATVTRDDYIDVLKRLHALHVDLCDAVAPALGPLAHPVLQPTQLLHGLRSDLAALAASQRVVRPAAPVLASPERAVGAWYVLEGAALGGLLIARHLRRILGEDLPLAHFGGPRARERWPDFLRHLDAVIVSEWQRGEAIDGARLAFVLTETALGKD